MENTLAIILLAFIVILCACVAVGNLLYRRRRLKRPTASLKNLELIKEQGLLTEEEFESLKDGVSRPQGFSIESCTVSAEEIMEAIDAALKPVDELERDKNYTGNEEWAEAFGIHSALNLSLKELALLSMKAVKPREAIELIAEVVSMNVPIDALEAAQNKGKSAFPNYKAIARMIWVKTQNRLAEPVSVQKEIHKQRKLSDQSLLADLVAVIMKILQMPITASGFAVLLALVIAKMEFNAFSDDEVGIISG